MTNFRTKFEEKIQNEKLRQALYDAFDIQLAKESEELLNILWKLTYDPKPILSELGLTIEEDENHERVPISKELIIPLRNELRYQYKMINREFCEPNASLPGTIKQAFNNLKAKTDNDEIVATIMLHKSIKFIIKMRSHIQPEMSIARSLYLLNDDNPQHLFGGIRNIGCNYLEAVFLKPYATQIYDLHNAICENKFIVWSLYKYSFTEEEIYADDNTIEASPVEESEDEAEAETETETKIETEFEKEPEKVLEENSQGTFTPLTIENIIANKDIFFSFFESMNFEYLIQLRELGFDLNEVVSKRSDLITAIKAVKIFG